MAIHLPMAKLSPWRRVAFSAALLERMLPNYQMFSQACGFGKYEVLRNQLNTIWQWLDKTQKVKINCEAQMEKLEEHIPDPEEHDFFGVFPALDAAMGMYSLLQSINDKDVENFSNVSRLSENSVRAYVELILAESLPEDEDVAEQEIKQHPLMEWERNCQNELFDFLIDAPENKKSTQIVRAMMLEEGMSNLGIEIA